VDADVSRRDFGVQLAKRSLAEFLDDRCPQLAASIAYHVLFSIFPLAIVLAAMYMLRLISAVLHEARGPRVSDEALDLRAGELALIVPVVAALLVLSAWPAGISHHSFANDDPQNAIVSQFR